MTKKLVLKHAGYVMLPRKTVKDKKIPINLNTYRNLHCQVNNEAKKIAKQNVKEYLRRTCQDGLRFTKPVDVTFHYTKPTKRIMDKSNVFAVASKYLYDALVELNILVDDNDEFIHHEILQPTTYEKGVSEITLTFTEID
jgi:hypothetical protein